MKAKTLLIATMLLGLLLAACAPAATPAPAMPTMAPAATAAPGLEDGAQSVGTDVQPVPASAGVNRMVIKNGDIEVLVEDVDASLARITQMAADYGGYVVNSQTWDSDGYKHATLQIAVPSAQFEATLNQLRNLGVKVLREAASGQDVSAEYVDLRSRLTNLEATAARVREFLKDAKTVEESLHVNQQLSDLEAQIEQVKGQMKYYEGRAAFSTISIALTPQLAPAVEPAPAWDHARTFERASKVLVRLAQVGADTLIWLGVLLGPVVVVALIGLALFSLSRRALRKAKA